MKEICCGTFACGFLRPKAVIVADNVLKPGSPLFLWLITRRASSGGRYARCTDNLWHWCENNNEVSSIVKHCFRDVSATKGCFLTSRVVSNLFCQGRTVQDRDPLSGRAAWCNIVAVQSVSATVCKYFLEYNCTILRINSLSLSLFSTSL